MRHRRSAALFVGGVGVVATWLQLTAADGWLSDWAPEVADDVGLGARARRLRPRFEQPRDRRVLLHLLPRLAGAQHELPARAPARSDHVRCGDDPGCRGTRRDRSHQARRAHRRSASPPRRSRPRSPRRLRYEPASTRRRRRRRTSHAPSTARRLVGATPHRRRRRRLRERPSRRRSAPSPSDGSPRSRAARVRAPAGRRYELRMTVIVPDVLIREFAEVGAVQLDVRNSSSRRLGPVALPSGGSGAPRCRGRSREAP